jgi:hypothetical protein
MDPDHVVPLGAGTADTGRTSTGAVAAVELAAGPNETLWRQVGKEVRWSLRPPWIWLGGVAFNLVLSLLWLIVAPLTGRPHHDWAIIVGTYFAVWILADVTTTNALGADALRVRINLLRGIPLRRVLLIKNLALMLLVGLPTLVATGIITVMHEGDYRLALTLPGVLFPILTWLGVGNFASVLLPVATCSWREHWRQRGDHRRTLRWLACLALPYVLLSAVDPVSDLPRFALRHLRFLPPTVQVHGAVLGALGLALWGACTSLALVVNRLRPIRIR